MRSINFTKAVIEAHGEKKKASHNNPTLSGTALILLRDMVRMQLRR